jgi:hypothetical protein
MERQKKDETKINQFIALFVFFAVLVGLFSAIENSGFYVSLDDSYHLYNSSTYHNISIPAHVKLYFSDFQPCKYAPFYHCDGRYYPNGDIITVYRYMDDIDMNSILEHEIAHYNYFKVMSPEHRAKLDYEYMKVCKNPNEMYAYQMMYFYLWGEEDG